MFLGYIPGTINRIQNSADPDNPSAVLFGIATFFININGLLNALAYGCNDSVRKDLSRCCSGGEEEPAEGSHLPPMGTSPSSEGHVQLDEEQGGTIDSAK